MTIDYSKVPTDSEEGIAPAGSAPTPNFQNFSALPASYGGATYGKDDLEAAEPGGKPALPVATPIPDAPVVALGFEDKETRLTFIRRVYSILSAQLLLTGGVCAFMVVHQPTQSYVLSHAWPINLTIALSFVLIFALMCYKDAHPHNVVLLTLFTLVESFLVGTVTTAYCASGYKGVVLEAVFLTGAVFVGLTLFTFQSKIDFSFLGASLSMGLGVLIVWGLFAMIFGFYDGYYYALFGCIIFCGYILFDTWLVMEKLSPHEYVLAAIMLYLDIINLFLYILRLLSESNRS